MHCGARSIASPPASAAKQQPMSTKRQLKKKPPHCHPATPVAQLRSQESSSAAPEAALALAATAITVSASTAAAAACFLACFSSFLASEGQHSTAQHSTPQERRQHRVHSGQLNIPGPLWLHQSLQLTHQCWWSASTPPSAGSNFKWHITCTAAQG
jgi:hypothetical protein